MMVVGPLPVSTGQDLAPVADLAVESLVVKDSQGRTAHHAQLNDELTIITRVKNNGPQAANNFTVYITATFSSDTSQNSHWCRPFEKTTRSEFLEPDGVEEFTVIPKFDVDGAQQLTIRSVVGSSASCDSNGVQPIDPDDDNNARTTRVNVGGLPDLTSGPIAWCANNENSWGTYHPDNCADMAGKNFTRGDADNLNTTFLFRVDNNGTASLADPNDSGSNLTFVANVTIRHKASGALEYLTPVENDAAGYMISEEWNLSGKAGWYNVTVRLDAGEDLRELNENNNTRYFELHVASSDLIPTVDRSNFATDPADALPLSSTGGSIDVNVTVDNPGLRPVTESWTWAAILDPGTAHERLIGANETVIADVPSGDHHNVTKSFDYCHDPNKPNCHLEVGEHVLRVIVDTEDAVYEENEANNIDDVRFYLRDDTPPRIDAEDFGVVNATPLKNGEPTEFTADITEQDIYLTNVNLTVEVPGRAEPLNYTMTRDGRVGDVQQFSVMVWEGFSARGTYNYSIVATDPSGNTATSPVKEFQVAPWPKRVAIHTPEEGQVFDWTPAGTSIDFHVTINSTGIEPAWNTTGKNITIQEPGEVPQNYTLGSVWTGYECSYNEITGYSGAGPNSGERCEGVDGSGAQDEFEINWPSATTPGRWNFTIWVEDIAGDVKSVPSYFILQDALPEILHHNVTDSVDAGDEVAVDANVTDDFDITRVQVNFTHAHGHQANKTLSLRNASDSGGIYDTTVSTGRAGLLKWAGTYNWTIAVLDENGNWNETSGEVQVNDTEDPRLVDVGVSHPVTEVDRNVTFYATPADDTVVNVSVSLVRGASQTLPTIYLTDPDGDGNFTHETAFTQAGDYTFQVTVTDSASKSVASNQLPLHVAGNLPPRVTLLEPSVRHEDKRAERITDATPALAFTVTDGDGVDAATVNLTVDGVEAPLGPPQTVENGWQYAYALPDTYDDGATITVEVKATDESARRLNGTATFTLFVDAAAPETPEPEFEPRYRTGGVVYNVSYHTTFTLESDDAGDPASGVDVIKWRLDKDSPGAVQTYDGPFKISKDTPGHKGTGDYKLMYWAEDAVGNAESPNVLRIRLDDRGPVVTYFPTGTRYVNASVTDTQGVSDVTLHHRRQGEVAYSAAPMELKDNLWRGVLPQVGRTVTLEYYISAEDNLGNEGFSGRDNQPFSYTPDNHAPAVTFTQPGVSATIGGVTQVSWSGDDADGDQLTYTIEYKLSRERDFRELAPLNPGQRAVQWDTTQVPDGTYDLRITASDGQAIGQDALRVRVENAKSPATPYLPNGEDVRVGETLRFTARINKAATNVTAVFYRNGAFWDTAQMRDDGTGGDLTADDHVYTVEYRFVKSGDYTWRVNVTYEDEGTIKRSTSDGPGTVNVFLTASDVFSANIGLWMAVMVLTLAAAAVGGYALYVRGDDE